MQMRSERTREILPNSLRHIWTSGKSSSPVTLAAWRTCLRCWLLSVGPRLIKIRFLQSPPEVSLVSSFLPSWWWWCWCCWCCCAVAVLLTTLDLRAIKKTPRSLVLHLPVGTPGVTAKSLELQMHLGLVFSLDSSLEVKIWRRRPSTLS